MQAKSGKDFEGTWRLLEYSFHYEDGTVEHPWGDAVVGYLLYSAEGYMSGNLSPAHRNWRSGRTRLMAEVPAGEKRELRHSRKTVPRDYIAYSGRYTVKDETVTHHVEVSLFPNWVGLPQMRFYAFEENRLTLRTPPLKSGRHRVVAELRWERVAAR